MTPARTPQPPAVPRSDQLPWGLGGTGGGCESEDVSGVESFVTADQTSGPPKCLLDFLWNVHVLLVAHTELLPIDKLKDAYSNHLGHKFPTERFLARDKGGLQATLKRIPHIVTTYTLKEGGPLLVKASQPVGTTKEAFIDVDQEFLKQLRQRAPPTSSAKCVPAPRPACGSPHRKQRKLENPVTPALVTPPTTPGPWRSGFIFSEDTPRASREESEQSRVGCEDLTASPAAIGTETEHAQVAEQPVDAAAAAAIPAGPQQWVSHLQQLLQTMPEEHVRSYMTGWCIDLLSARCAELGLPARGGKGLLITRILGHVKALPPAATPPPAKASRARRRRLD